VPWMEILIVIGIAAEVAVLKVLLAVGGARLVLFTAFTGFGAAFVNHLISLDDPYDRANDEPSGAFMVTLAMVPPAILVLSLFAQYGLPH